MHKPTTLDQFSDASISLMLEQLDEKDPLTRIITRSKGTQAFKQRLLEAYWIARKKGRFSSDDLPHEQDHAKDVQCPHCFQTFPVRNNYGDRINGCVLKLLQRNGIIAWVGRKKSDRTGTNHATTIEVWDYVPDWWRRAA